MPTAVKAADERRRGGGDGGNASARYLQRRQTLLLDVGLDGVELLAPALQGPRLAVVARHVEAAVVLALCEGLVLELADLEGRRPEAGVAVRCKRRRGWWYGGRRSTLGANGREVSPATPGRWAYHEVYNTLWRLRAECHASHVFVCGGALDCQGANESHNTM